jgi:nitroreductase
MNPKRYLRNILEKAHLLPDATSQLLSAYERRYRRFAFSDTRCGEPRQYEAVITRWYHTIEKGLAHSDAEYRPGFGRDNIEKLLALMEAYSRKFDTTAFFYETALCCLHRYADRNRRAGAPDPALEARIAALPGRPNDAGGAVSVPPVDAARTASLPFRDLLADRHSVRQFSPDPVSRDLLARAIGLAQLTPSACNRQGWQTIAILDSDVIASVLANQNGNRGFGHAIPALLLVTCDLRAFNRRRELFQAYIDGGMYAAHLLDALHASGLAAVPLSASLTLAQENNVRRILSLHDAEVLILFVGVGHPLPSPVSVPRSARNPAPPTRFFPPSP